VALSVSPLPLIVLFIVLATWLTLRGHRPARAFLLIFGIFYAAVLISFLRSVAVLRNSAGMDGIVSFSLHIPVHIPAWIHLDSRVNQSGIAQVCSLINLESLLYFP
jgi:hypothetical protein